MSAELTMDLKEVFGLSILFSESRMHPYAEQIEKVRQLATAHIRRCGGQEDEIRESFLVNDNRFVGVRFVHSTSEARWICGSELVDLIRGGQVVARMPLGDSTSTARRAA